MAADEASSYQRKVFLAGSLVAAPVVVFFSILLAYGLNVPVTDDYDSALDYLNRMAQTEGLWAKFVWCLTAQHNEYKTILGNAIVWLQQALFGSIDFRLTCILGNLFVVFIAFLLWKMFLPREKDLLRRLLLFVPASLLLFQLNYVETLNWATPGLQNLPVVAFAFASIYLLGKDTPGAYYAALVMLTLSISASTNGFFLLPVGVLILLGQRRFGRAAGWIGVTGACLGVYLIHYVFHASLKPEAQSFIPKVYTKVLYLLGFVGGAAFIPKPASIVLGAAIVCYFIFLFRRGYLRRNPTVAYCVLFLLTTAAAVTMVRAQVGLWGSVTSRYRIYCDLLLIFAWFSFVEEFLPKGERLRSSLPFKAVLIASFLFWFAMDAYGIYELRKRDHLLVQGMALYQHPRPGQPREPFLTKTGEPQPYGRWEEHSTKVLEQSIQLGLYRMPGF